MKWEITRAYVRIMAEGMERKQLFLIQKQQDVKLDEWIMRGTKNRNGEMKITSTVQFPQAHIYT